MGSLLRAACPCGFETEVLPVGSGYRDHTMTLKAPAYCDGCKTIVVSEYQTKTKRCSTCREHLTFYNDPALQSHHNHDPKTPPVFRWRTDDSATEFVLSDILYLCPACRKKTMKFTDAGCWD